jgi:hypothetical protein
MGTGKRDQKQKQVFKEQDSPTAPTGNVADEKVYKSKKAGPANAVKRGQKRKQEESNGMEPQKKKLKETARGDPERDSSLTSQAKKGLFSLYTLAHL